MFLGIDLGTSGVKAVVIDDGGTVVDEAGAPLAVSRPRDGWSEQDPASWWTATTHAICALDADVRRQVRGVGLAGQMHGAVLLDDAHRTLRPAILWNDGRSHAECAELEAAVPDLHAITGNLAMPGFTAPKLLWVLRHEPELFARIATVLLPKDWLRLQLTGVPASDLSDSAGTLWLDVAERRWSAPVLAACGLGEGHMPQLFEGNQVTGHLLPAVAEAWGLSSVPVAAGGGDNAAGAVGVGVVRDGDALLSLGTSGVVFVATADHRANPQGAVHAFCHCLPGLWHQMAVHLSAAACIDWGARLTGAGDPAAFFALAEAAGPAAGPEIFLPYLSGERTPHNDPHVRGALLGLDHDTDPARVAAAVLEGVAFALADGMDALRAAGTVPAQLSVIGGGARSRHWGRIIASVLDTPLVYLKGGETGPAIGAARLAQLAVDGGTPADVCSAPPTAHVVEPEAGIADRLAAKRERFRAAYRPIASL
jgi:xylulokinase